VENKIVTRSLKKQLDQVIIHEQVENDITINRNLSVDKIEEFLNQNRNFRGQKRYL
jgi:hypothetical protein